MTCLSKFGCSTGGGRERERERERERQEWKCRKQGNIK
jgi:hypothetical protein